MAATSMQRVPLNEARLLDLLAGSFPESSMPSLRQANELSGHDNSLLVRPIPGSYTQVLNGLMTLDFAPGGNAPRTLPPELSKRVLSYLTVQRVRQQNIVATNTSSHDNMHDLSMTLIDNGTTWWLSRPGSMPNGRGSQWVQFLLNHNGGCLERLSSVSIKIPPMPQGPLSVKEFCLQQFSIERGWHAFTPIYQTSNQTGWQTFSFEEVDVSEVRLVCLSNHIAEYLSNPELSSQKSRFESVGFFSLRFQ
mmetsp:Transcript_4262/g.8955  ORF Transcript_4262/g.8955 Transcript_4262/m.8955 type:complete len:250 (+) Transcript_4262:87-836(+)